MFSYLINTQIQDIGMSVLRLRGHPDSYQGVCGGAETSAQAAWLSSHFCFHHAMLPLQVKSQCSRQVN